MKLLCPAHREPLSVDLVCPHGERYPAMQGVPILLADPAARERLLRQETSAADALAFYNRTGDHDSYCRSELETVRRDLSRYLPQAGPTLEIGSGKGALQGMGAGYIACDYSLSALLAWLSPEHGRICASADALPFPDGSFSCVFSIAALEHVTRADLAFAEIDRVLAPGGVAYLAPAWHCVQANCEGIPVRPFSDLSLRQKLVKATLPLRQNILLKAAGQLPMRLARRALWSLRPRATALRFTALRPDYQTFWMSDSDAAARLDSHEGALFFHSRRYDVIKPGNSAMRQLLARHQPLVARKPCLKAEGEE